MHLIRLTSHPTHDGLIVMKTPRELSEAVRRFEPAQYAPDLYAYLIDDAPDVLAALRQWANVVGAKVVDDRSGVTRGEGGPRLLAVECANCQQPAKTLDQPTMCPGCGQPWVAKSFDPHDADAGLGIVRHACTVCGHRQSSRAPFCSKCGGPMLLDVRPSRRPEREHLSEPKPWSEVVEESNPDLFEQIQQNGARLGIPVYGRADWLAYRKFWKTIPRKHLGSRPPIEAWDEAGRPETYAGWAS